MLHPGGRSGSPTERHETALPRVSAVESDQQDSLKNLGWRPQFSYNPPGSVLMGLIPMKGLSSPHLLLASSNPLKMIQNLNHLLAQNELAKLTTELDRNVVALFRLGTVHLDFASGLDDRDWRQKISRFYYAAYNVRRAVALKHSGAFTTDSSDHKNVDQLPDGVANRESHINNLRNLREDRNLADYSHLAEIGDLVISPADALTFTNQFISDCRDFLIRTGVDV